MLQTQSRDKGFFSVMRIFQTVDMDGVCVVFGTICYRQ